MKKILVVEDELSIANFITEVIRILGYEAKILTNGRKVLTTAKEWKPDLITLDIMMPSPDGVEVLSQLKSDPETQGIPVFIISVAAKDPAIAPKISQAQMIYQKPLDPKEFMEGVRKVLGPGAHEINVKAPG